jgi:hypothetical protein
MKYIIVVNNWPRETTLQLENLCPKSSVFFFNVYSEDNPSLLTKIFRKILYFLGFPLHGIYYDGWIKYVKDPDAQLIFFDATRPYRRISNIIRHSKNKPVLYFWNPIDNDFIIRNAKKKYRVFSYSTFDCQKYGLLFNHSFCPMDNKKNVSLNDSLIYDGIFVGKNKGRLNILEKISPAFEAPFFWIVKDDNESSVKLPLQNSNLSYSDYIKNAKKSKCIIEIVPDQYCGDTLRVSEAVFLQKKLITNHQSITDEWFYNSNNILLINDSTKPSDIRNFLHKPFSNYSKEVQDYFSFLSWLERFSPKALKKDKK